jgi:hypothetical protein
MRAVSKAAALIGAALLSVLVTAPAAHAQVPVPITVSGHTASASIELPNGLGAELTITFEEVVGLNPESLAVTATVVNPRDLSLLARIPGALPLLPPPLPSLAPVTIPAAFPVLLRVSPPATSTLSFSGRYAISLHTHNLQLDSAVPYALYKAHDGGVFRDIMRWEGRGSYRAGGGGGDFSEFLILVDRRPIDTVILEKFAALDLLLTENATSIPPTVLTSLLQRLASARAFFDSGAIVAAVSELANFSSYVAAHSGAEIPDVWRANSDEVNVGGLLRSAADTLRFSLDRKTGR